MTDMAKKTLRTSSASTTDVPDFEVLPLTRKGRAFQTVRYNQIAEKLPDGLLATVTDLEDYLQVVTQTTLRELVAADGQSFALPNGTASIDEHVEAFVLFQDCDVRLTDAIMKRIADFNAPPAPREVLPDDALTDEEKADPSSSSDEKKSEPD